ncbi:MAG TPA: Maf family protein [Synergistaceae bacterium]|nr:Maf family protein [Synergistaceae bacterium]HQH78168.1 Maf family protein [Synergistaceae bacterium]HQK24472.1 Maf family protein [Synergistaceae bacterium]
MAFIEMSPLPPLVLASGSPRRRALLEELGWSFAVVPTEVDETPEAGESPEAVARRLAEAKAAAGARAFPGALVLGADTLVALGDRFLGKPRHREEAEWMLSFLQGREHRVVTGVALEWGPRKSSAVEVTRVRFRSLDPGAVRAYVATGEGDDKAGAYAIQGRGALLVEGIDGCYFNVVGLPLGRVSVLLEGWGVSLERQWTPGGEGA